MWPRLDLTHDPAAQSWVASAQSPTTDFPAQNLPFGVFSLHGHAVADDRIGVAIGDQVLDLHGCIEAQVLGFERPDLQEACRAQKLNDLLALDRSAWLDARLAVFDLLTTEDPHLRSRVRRHLRAQADVVMAMPVVPGDYTDFYASIDHARNVGSMFRPDSPLMPNYRWVPIGYHGRASSVVVSGSEIRRPAGQVLLDGADTPVFAPSRRLDYELEMALVVGHGNALGTPVTLDEAEAHLFGLCLLNDWSARDIQAWEVQPLGPFLSKSFATTLSPWVVTFDALEPFRVAPRERQDGEPAPLPYLASVAHAQRGGVDVQLGVWIQSAAMREAGQPPTRLSCSEFRQMYWTFVQLLSHHTSNGCNLRPGDLIGSGTVSGPRRDQRGCLLELAWRGSDPVELPSGEQRRFLEDGDEVTFRAWCESQGRRRIGFGECHGRVVACEMQTGGA